MMRCKLFILILFIALSSFATHNRAGYISYSRIGTSGYKYHFKIFTYTNPSSVGADRPYETLIFTNISSSCTDTLSCPRTNTTPGVDLCSQNLSCCQCGSNQGLMLVYPYAPSCASANYYGGVKVNTYEGDYDFHNASMYVFGMVDPNFDSSIQNISNSSNVAFALLDTLTIYPYSVNNNSPIATNAPIDNACAGHPFHYNPGMLDADNDVLSYSLIPFLTGTTACNFFPISGYSLSPAITVDPVTGDISWLPVVPNTDDGEYEIDLLIREYRKIGGVMKEVGSTVFAIQLYVECCSTSVVMSQTTTIKGCVEAGQNYNSPVVTATELNNTSSGNLNMTATGVPLTAPNHGVFNLTGAVTPNQVSGYFSWTPTCNSIQLNPYYVTVNASDNNSPHNAGYSTISLQVVSPPVTNLVAAVTGDSVKLTWSAPSCGTNTANVIVDYIIYRANDCTQYLVSPCTTGVPAAPTGATSWYQPIGTSTSPIFYDDNNRAGLPAGTTYSYIVIAQYADGSLSMASAFNWSTTCITLHLGIPILTNVSVDTTNISKGRMFVRWHKPLVGGQNLDTTTNPLTGHQGPYHFVLQRDSVRPGALSTTGTYTTIYTSPTKTFFALLNTLADTTFIDTVINTYGKQFYYKVLFYDTKNGLSSYVGSGSPASSIFASGVGHDKKVVLSWTSNTPWTNTKYYIYRQNYGGDLSYRLVDSTALTVDTVKHLTNKYPYCFRIKSVGTYFNTAINDSTNLLINWSQKVCVAPIDDSPPCQPKLNIVGNCNESINKLTWTNPDHICNINDVLKYYIYYTPRQDSVLTKIDSVFNVNDTTYATDYNFANIAGCYVIVAVDSAGNQSPLNNETCTDDCPEYELPNIFTPNGDNINDLYVPVKNRYVRSVDFTLYNRWGEVVYENTEPKLGWDGKSKQMKQLVPDGVYFYTCTVNEIHYYGIQVIKLKGFVQVLK